VAAFFCRAVCGTASRPLLRAHIAAVARIADTISTDGVRASSRLHGAKA
jgi:hypothetical protein